MSRQDKTLFYIQGNQKVSFFMYVCTCSTFTQIYRPVQVVYRLFLVNCYLLHENIYNIETDSMYHLVTPIVALDEFEK